MTEVIVLAFCILVLVALALLAAAYPIYKAHTLCKERTGHTFVDCLRIRIKRRLRRWKRP